MKIKKQTFMKGIITVLISQILVKFLGFIYRVVITNVPGFGDEGNAYYGTAYKVYALLLAIATTGIPNAISKLVSEKIAVGDKKGAYRIFRTALYLFMTIGAVFFVVLLVGADFISTHIMANSNAAYSIMALSPALFFVAISAVFRGFFAGLKDMRAQGVSQVLEQLFNCVFSILFVGLLVSQSPEIMAIGSALGTSLATIISAIYLVTFYLRRKDELTQELKNAVEVTNESNKSIIKKIVKLSIPISLASIVLTLSGVIDLATVKRCLLTFMGEEEATTQIGILFGKVDMLTNLPLALNVAFAMVLVPTIASAIAVGNNNNAKNKASLSLLITILIGLPCMFGFIVLADPILKLLFPGVSEGKVILQLASLAVLSSAIGQTLSGTLQGLGKVMVPAIATLIGSAVKLFFNLILIPIPSIGINGAAISSAIGQAIIAIIMFMSVNKTLKLNINIVKYMIKPICATVIMSISAFLIHKGINVLTGSNVMATIGAIFIAAIIFVVFVVVFKIFSKEEIESLPLGNKIVKVLVKAKLYT